MTRTGIIAGKHASPASRVPPLVRLLLIASSGRHIFGMFCLREFWKDKARYWISFPSAEARYLLKDEREVYWAAYTTIRDTPNLLRNQVLSSGSSAGIART